MDLSTFGILENKCDIVNCQETIQGQCNTNLTANRGSYEALKSVHFSGNTCHTDLFLSVRLGLVSMHICIKYEASMISHVGRKRQMAAIKNIGHTDLIFLVW